MEDASKIGVSYIALREISFKLRSSFPYRSYRLPGYFFRYPVNTLTLYYIISIKPPRHETNPAGFEPSFI